VGVKFCKNGSVDRWFERIKRFTGRSGGEGAEPATTPLPV
jgi:hypothetical protein